jgi:WD40 repeat protein
MHLSARIVALAMFLSASSLAQAEAEIVIQAGHAGGITGAAYSGDGQHILTASRDSTLRLWEARSGREIRVLSGHTSAVMDVVFLPDGKRAASASVDHTVRIWDTETGKELRTLSGHNDWVNRVVVSPDGKLLASASGDETVRVWEVETGREIARLEGHRETVSAVAFSPDGKWLASANGLSKGVPSPMKILFWRTSDWREDHAINLSWDQRAGRGPRSANALSFSPDSRRIACSGSGIAAVENQVRVFDVQSGDQLWAQASGNGFARAAFSPDGKYVAAASFDKTARVWDSGSGKEIHLLDQNESWVTVVAFAPTGDTLLTAGVDRSIRLWSVESGKKLRDIAGGALIKTGLVLAGNDIFTGGRGATLQRWDLVNGQMTETVMGKPGVRENLRNGDGGLAFYIGRREDGQFDAQLQRSQQSWRALQNRPDKNLSAIAALAATPDGRQLLYADPDFKLRRYEIATKKTSEPFAGLGHAAYINSLALSADGRVAVSGGADKTVMLWDVTGEKKLRDFMGADAEVRAVAISPDGRRVAAASWDGATRVWDAASGMLLHKLERRNSERYWAVVFSPDGKTIATGDTQQITLWDADSGRQLKALMGHRNYVFSVAFLPDGQRLVSSSADGTVRLWDIASGRDQLLPGSESVALRVAAAADGKRVFAASIDGAVRIWDVASAALVASFVSFTDGEWVTVASNGYFNTSANGSKWLNVRKGRQIFGLDQYFDAFYRPDYLKLALQGDAAAEAASTASASRAELAKAEQEAERAQAQLARERARREAAEAARAQQFAQERARQEAESARLKQEQEAARLKAERELARAKEEEARVKQLADAKARQEAEAVRIKQEQESARVKAELALAQARAEEQARAQLLAEAKAQQEAEAARIKQEQEAARIKADLALAQARAEEEARRQAATTSRPGGAGRASRMEQIKPAPRIELADLPARTAERQINLALQLGDAGGGIGEVRIFLNGAAVLNDGTRNLAVAATGERRTYPVRLVNGVNQIRIIVYNADNTMQSDPIEKEIIAEFATQKRPILHALVIGIQEFDNPVLNLKYSVTDADLFGEVIARNARGLFQDIKVTKLTTKAETTRDRILQTLDAMQKQVEPDDLFVFYVASHGTVDDGEYFLIPSNVGSTSTARLKRDAISQNDLKSRLANNAATKKFIVLDTCNSGRLGDALQVALLTRGMNNDTAMKILSRSMGTTILSAATSTQEALEGYENHGLFTYVVAKGMDGAADTDKDGFVKTTELADYVDNEVPEIAEKIFNRKQYPVISPSGQAFPIAKNGRN